MKRATNSRLVSGNKGPLFSALLATEFSLLATEFSLLASEFTLLASEFTLLASELARFSAGLARFSGALTSSTLICAFANRSLTSLLRVPLSND